MKIGYVWYSFGSDKTGPDLGKALDFDAGKKTPPFDRYQIIIGWGCKPGSKYKPEELAQLVAQGKIRILNHPDEVERNRNKLETLKRLKEVGVSVPGFVVFDPAQPLVTADTVVPNALTAGEITFPLVLHNQTHKGDPIVCYTIEDVRVALKGNVGKDNPICYARTYDHGDEYRIHVFRDVAMIAQKKALEEDPVAAAAETLIRRVESGWEKQKRKCTHVERELVREVTLYLAGDILKNAAQLQKSVTMGWKFMDWGMDLVPPAVASLAIDALDAVHLDLGAVSVSYANGVARILSITTAPNLTPEHSSMYVNEIKAFVAKGGKAKPSADKKEPKRENRASPELVARLYRSLRDISAERAEAVLKSLEE